MPVFILVLLKLFAVRESQTVLLPLCRKLSVDR